MADHFSVSRGFFQGIQKNWVARICKKLVSNELVRTAIVLLSARSADTLGVQTQARAYNDSEL